MLRCAPDAAHVELEANTVDAVLGAALQRLAVRGQLSVGTYLGALDSVHRLEAALAVLGQALRVPVKLRAGACDRQRVSALEGAGLSVVHPVSANDGAGCDDGPPTMGHLG